MTKVVRRDGRYGIPLGPELGALITSRRIERFGTRANAVLKTGMSQQTWNKLESGGSPHADTLSACVRFLWPEHTSVWYDLEPFRHLVPQWILDFTGEERPERSLRWMSETTLITEKPDAVTGKIEGQPDPRVRLIRASHKAKVALIRDALVVLSSQYPEAHEFLRPKFGMDWKALSKRGQELIDSDFSLDSAYVLGCSLKVLAAVGNDDVECSQEHLRMSVQPAALLYLQATIDRASVSVRSQRVRFEDEVVRRECPDSEDEVIDLVNSLARPWPVSLYQVKR